MTSKSALEIYKYNNQDKKKLTKNKSSLNVQSKALATDLNRSRDFDPSSDNPMVHLDRFKSASVANFNSTRNPQLSTKGVPQVSVRLNAKKKVDKQNYNSVVDHEVLLQGAEDQRKFALQQPKEQFLSIVGKMSGDQRQYLHRQKMQSQ